MKRYLSLTPILFFCLVPFLTAGCGTYRQVAQVDDHAFLLLLGQVHGHTLIIDKNPPIQLGVETRSYNLNGIAATKIEISIGGHEITIANWSGVVISRKFYVATGESYEVKL